jgi:hypothetical protein
MITAAMAVLVTVAAACMPGPPSPPSSTAGDTELSSRDLEAFLGNGLRFTGHGDFGLDRAELVAAPDAPGGTLLRVTYPAGSASRSAGGTDGGMQAYLELPSGPVQALDLAYQLRFPSDFDFVKGGKLPGLYGGTVTGGRHIPDGADGFSTRYMWRAGGEGEVYAYLPTSEVHGTSLGRGCWSFPPGRWTSIRQRVLLNTPGHADGRVIVWQDGRKVLDSRGLEFRTTGELRIEGLFFSTFFGGSDTSWASPVDQHADFAGFAISGVPDSDAPDSDAPGSDAPDASTVSDAPAATAEVAPPDCGQASAP